MEINFEIPNKVKEFAKKELISIGDVKDEILSRIDEDLLDKDYKYIEIGKVLVVINGLSKNKKNKIFISPKEISKKKPLKTASSGYHEGSVYYLIFNEK